MLFLALSLQGFDGGADLAVEQSALDGQKLAECRLADPLVREVKVLAQPSQHPAPHEFLDRLRRIPVAAPGDVLEKLELKFAPDDACNGNEPAASVTQAIEVSNHELADAVGQGESHRIAAGGILIDGA